MNNKLGRALATILLLISSNVFATAYNVPPPSQSLIGEIQYSSTGYSDNAATIAQRYDIGYNAIANANPHLGLDGQSGQSLPSGAPLVIATQHLLPNHGQRGIVINLPEMRMYYFLGNGQVLTYPIGIGKIGKTIPIKNTFVQRKMKDPVWVPPQDIREFNLQQGIVLPRVMPAGPDNPLGPYAIYTGIPTYLMHSTIFPESIGKRASFGCIRMFESDIKEFFPAVEHGIPIAIINEPVKVGWQDNHLYVEAHQPLEEHGSAYNATLGGLVHTITATAKNQPTLVDWQMVSFIAQERDGLPHDVGVRVSY